MASAADPAVDERLAATSGAFDLQAIAFLERSWGHFHPCPLPALETFYWIQDLAHYLYFQTSSGDLFSLVEPGITTRVTV